MKETHQQMARRVWRSNVDEEMARMKDCLKRFPLIAFDTEYPGIILPTFVNSSNEEFYSAMKVNVENTKLIQCGFTLLNALGEIGGTWEFNFCNFGDPSDPRNEISIEFLKRNGLDLQMIRDQGIDMFGYNFFPKLMTMFRSQEHVEYITFQGAYDFAYVLCIFNNGKLPDTQSEFLSEVMKTFGEVYDTKVMAGYCKGLGEHLGLSKLAQLLNITRVGRAHHAGSDSLITALVFTKLQQVYEECRYAKGLIYGIGKSKLLTATVPEPEPEQPTRELSYGIGKSRLLTDSVPELTFSPFMYQSNRASYPMIHNGYVTNYDQPQVYYLDHLGAPWTLHNGVLVPFTHHLPSSTFAYPSHQTPAPVEYLRLFPN